MKQPHIWISNDVTTWFYVFEEIDLRSIGDFTAENILQWFEDARKWRLPAWGPFSGIEPTLSPSRPVVAFHAVCGDKVVDWKTREPWEPVKWGKST
jgi:hypothetical protein